MFFTSSNSSTRETRDPVAMVTLSTVCAMRRWSTCYKLIQQRHTLNINNKAMYIISPYSIHLFNNDITS